MSSLEEEKSMLHKHVTTVGLALALLGLASTLAFAQADGGPAGSTGVIATITAIDARTSVATLQTEAGEVFELPQRPLWTMGTQVLCDRIEDSPPRLRHCQLWGVQSLAPRAGRFTDTELPRAATPKGLFSPTD
jgi:hypothetical protein